MWAHEIVLRQDHTTDVALTSVPLLLFNVSVDEFSHLMLKPFN